jgi:hypothetical protein
MQNSRLLSAGQERSYKKIILKGSFSLLIILLAFFSTFFINLQEQPVCMSDFFFNLTKHINQKLSNKIDIRMTILILSSLCVDTIYFVFSFFWIKYAKSWRVIIVFTLYYSFRALIQSIFQMTTPAGYLWSYPGFPSMTVSYLKTNDFFPSGHVAFPIIVGLEFHHLKVKKMFYICMFCGIFEAMVMVVLRGHYCIDILAGFVMSHYSFILVEKYCYLLDNSKFSMSVDDIPESLENRDEKLDNSIKIEDK